MKKFLSVVLFLSLVAVIVAVFSCCGKQNGKNENTSDPEAGELMYSTVSAVDGNMKTYYEMNDGTWMCDNVIYKYRLEIKGRMPNAAVDSTFVYLSNLEEISFEQAYKAAGVSSDTNDYFSPEEAVLVEMK